MLKTAGAKKMKKIKHPFAQNIWRPLPYFDKEKNVYSPTFMGLTILFHKQIGP